MHCHAAPPAHAFGFIHCNSQRTFEKFILVTPDSYLLAVRTVGLAEQHDLVLLYVILYLTLQVISIRDRSHLPPVAVRFETPVL